jgi:hypothetical protein
MSVKAMELRARAAWTRKHALSILKLEYQGMKFAHTLRIPCSTVVVIVKMRTTSIATVFVEGLVHLIAVLFVMVTELLVRDKIVQTTKSKIATESVVVSQGRTPVVFVMVTVALATVFVPFTTPVVSVTVTQQHVTVMLMVVRRAA